MSVIEKLNFLAGNDHLIKEFLDFSFEINKESWYTDGKDHGFVRCGGQCLLIKLLIPIMEEN